MEHFVYILHSPETDNYYVGETEDLQRRKEEHRSHKYVGSQTIRATDWQFYLVIKCEGRIQARGIEKHIKKMKSRIYLTNLKKYPEMVEKLLAKYNPGSASR